MHLWLAIRYNAYSSFKLDLVPRGRSYLSQGTHSVFAMRLIKIKVIGVRCSLDFDRGPLQSTCSLSQHIHVQGN